MRQGAPETIESQYFLIHDALKWGRGDLFAAPPFSFDLIILYSR